MLSRLSGAKKTNQTRGARGTASRYWLVAVPLFIAPAAHAEAVPDVTVIEVPNGSFDAADVDPWMTYGDVVELVAGDCAQGTGCLRLGITGGAANNEAGIYQDVVVANPRSLRLSAGVAVDEALTGDTIVELKLELPDTSEVYGSVVVHSGATPVGEWGKPSLCLDVPGEQGHARPVVVVRSPTGTGTGVVRVDGFELFASLRPCPVPSSDDGGCAGALGLSPLSLLALAAIRWRAHARRAS